MIGVMQSEMEYCPICRKHQPFVKTESPSGYQVCTQCGYRESKKKLKLIITERSYEFKEE